MSGKTVILLVLIIIGLICVNLFVSNGFIRLLAIVGILGITFVLQGGRDSKEVKGGLRPKAIYNITLAFS
jgi:hypothetical protein